MGEDEQLRALHQAYVWEVNAAIGEGRLDLVQQFADDYLDQTLALIVGADTPGCDKAQCVVCQRARPAPGSSLRHGWRFLGRWHRAS